MLPTPTLTKTMNNIWNINNIDLVIKSNDKYNNRGLIVCIY